MKKKIIALVLCGLLVLSFCACTDSKPKKEPRQTTETVKTVEAASEVTSAVTESPQQETEEKEDTETADETEDKECQTTENETTAAEPTTTPTSEPIETQEPEVIFSDTDELVYATCSLNVRSGPGTSYGVVGTLSTGDSVKRTGTGSNGWSRIEYNNTTCYASGKYLTTEKVENPSAVSDSLSYPLTYNDSTCSITVNKEWYQNAYCYVAHVMLSDYSRLATTCGNGTYGGYETTSSAAKRVGAILCINGCYSAPNLDYGVVRNGNVYNDKACYVPAIYNGNTGIFSSPESAGVAGTALSTLAANGQVKDTFCFGPAFLVNGSVTGGNDSSRAQRTFMGTTGKAGEFYLVVSEGRNVDGKSSGLTYKECASLLQSKGCTFGIPLDGGGSSTMVFNGKVLNHLQGGSERAVVDFIYVK